jgi:CBS domain-containing protein
MQVREIMTENPACCTPETSLKEIAQMMVEHDCGCIPVVENMESKKPVGTVTDRDITIRAFATGRNPSDLKASDVMTVGITTITPEMSVQECCDVMEDKKIRRVLVTDESNRLRGIVAQADVAEYGPDPYLVSEMVHEISEASPSSQRGGMSNYRGSGRSSGSRRQFSGRRSYESSFERPYERSYERSYSDYRPYERASFQGSYSPRRRSYVESNSLLSMKSLLPLLIGVGTSMALKYYFDTGKTTSKPHIERHFTDTESLKRNLETGKSDVSLSHQTETEEPTVLRRNDAATTTTTQSDQTDSTDRDISRTAFHS